MLEWIPHPDTDCALRVLCLGAHSDDIEIGCGATLMRLAAGPRPVEVRWVVFGASGTRADEARASAGTWLDGVLGRQIDVHAFRDGFFPSDWSAIKEVFESLKPFSPDLVFTHCCHDLHQDHRTVNELTWNTFRNHSILEYEIPKYDGDLRTPNAYLPVPAETAQAKVAALMRHFGSQRSKHWFSEELFLGLMRIRGMECCAASGYAEGFHARKIRLGN